MLWILDGLKKLKIRFETVCFAFHAFFKFKILVKNPFCFSLLRCRKMKKPLPLSNSWNCSINEEPELYTLPGTKRKIKRKSREPKRLFPSPETETIKTVLVDMSDGNSKDRGTGYVNKWAPFHGQLMMSQEKTINSTKTLCGMPEDTVTPSQSGAIDMRIGINVPGLSSKVSQSPASPQSHHEISNWPSSISQPLSSRFKFGLHSTFPLSASTSGTDFSGCQGFSSAPSPPEQSAPFILRESRSSECLDQTETQLSSPKVNMQCLHKWIIHKTSKTCFNFVRFEEYYLYLIAEWISLRLVFTRICH